MLEGKQEAKNQTKNLDNFNSLGSCKISANGLNPLWIVKTFALQKSTHGLYLKKKCIQHLLWDKKEQSSFICFLT